MPSLLPLRSGLAMLALTLTLAGCAVAPTVETDKATLQKIKHVAILDLQMPDLVTIQNAGLLGGFGAIGGAIQGGSNADKSKAFTAAIAQRKPSLYEALVSAVAQSLKESGFEVTIVQGQKPKKAADGKSDDYSDIHVDGDAFLVVWAPLKGYVSPPQSLSYQPQVMLRARLVDAATKKDLYFKTFFVGYKVAVIAQEDIPAAPGHRYKSFDSLLANAGDAENVLINCEAIGARKIAADLKAN